MILPTMSPWIAQALTPAADDDLTPIELADLLAGLAESPDLGPLLARLQPAPRERGWELLARNDHVDVWIIAWSRGADTGWHDHDVSSGAFRVLSGTVIESRPSLRGRHKRRRVPTGDGVSFGPEHLHRLTASASRSTTVHAYSPPLERMGRYTVDDEGALRRHVAYEGASLAG